MILYRLNGGGAGEFCTPILLMRMRDTAGEIPEQSAIPQSLGESVKDDEVKELLWYQLAPSTALKPRMNKKVQWEISCGMYVGITI